MCLTAYTCIKRTALTTESIPFSVNKVSASIFNLSKTHVTLNSIYHNTDNVKLFVDDENLSAGGG